MLWRVILLWLLGAQFALADVPKHFRTNGSLVQTFNVDVLNELSTVTRTGALTVTGATPAPATNFTVNGNAAQTYADFTFARTNLTLANGNNTFTNIAQNAYGVMVTNIITNNLPATNSFQYDANGNLTNDGARNFVYDAENQLTNVNVAGQWKTEHIYDGFRRKRITREYVWQSGNWLKTNETRYIYDERLVIQERDSNNAVQVTYTRGFDLSGSGQGAGGIGGLLARTDGNGPTFYHADGNGNVTALIDENQNIAARYEYDGFGKLVGKWGTLADANAYRFSSKEFQRSSGLYSYGLRFYEPNFQRWLNRDPIAENGSINLYGFVRNGPLNGIDPLGLDYHWNEAYGIQIQGPAPYSSGDNLWENTVASLYNTVATVNNSAWQVENQAVNLVGAALQVVQDTSQLLNDLGVTDAARKVGLDDTTMEALGGYAALNPTEAGLALEGLQSLKLPLKKPTACPAKKPPTRSPKAKPPTTPPQMPPKNLPPGHSVREMPGQSPAYPDYYPNGYWIQYNQSGQPMDPTTGLPGAQPENWHVPFPPQK